MKNPKGFFDEMDRLTKLSNRRDPLLRLKEMINWESFRPVLDGVLKKEPKGKGGRPPYDYVLMFKVLILQRYYNLSDDQTEFQILDRMTFMRFLGLQLSDSVPDSKTIWNFKENLTVAGGIEKLFDQFGASLEAAGLLAHEGSIVDASFVEVPKQRNTRDENAKIKAGETPEGWEDNPHKLSQKDVHAKWTKKNNVNFYGYKNHIKADAGSKLVTKYVATPASVHDSQPLESLLEESDAGKDLHADSAYSGEPLAKVITKAKVLPQINEKGYKNKPLTDEQKASNKEKSHVRSRVEHIFGFIENSMGGSTARMIGFTRAQAVIGLMNITYNMFRALQLTAINKITMPV